MYTWYGLLFVDFSSLCKVGTGANKSSKLQLCIMEEISFIQYLMLLVYIVFGSKLIRHYTLDTSKLNSKFYSESGTAFIYNILRKIVFISKLYSHSVTVYLNKFLFYMLKNLLF